MRRKKSKNAVLVGLLGVVVLAVGWVRVVGIYGGSPNAASACHHERLADALTHQVPGLGAACYLGHVESNVRCGFLPRIVARTWDIANNRGGNCHDCWQRTSRSPLLSIAAFVIYSGNLHADWSLYERRASPMKKFIAAAILASLGLGAGMLSVGRSSALSYSSPANSYTRAPKAKKAAESQH